MNPQNPLILCVDDEKANLKLLEKLFVPRGYAVVCAASGKDALLKIKSQAIDLVLLDIIMPGMDGFEVCRQIKEDPKLRSIPVIMVTALTDKKDRIRGIEAGAEDFLSKPFDLAEVLARIKILLKMKGLDDERKRAEVELQKSNDELEFKVQERTAELVQANEMLRTEIIERERAEELIRAALEEKEVLLKEVHHRVKNNLMTIIGLIKMQETKAENKKFDPLLRELEGRIRSMALVHENLHNSKNLARIDLQSYIETMAAQIRIQYGAKQDILFRVRAAGVEADLDTAIPCGLILNELISNAYKHAFPRGKPGSGKGICEISVTANQKSGKCTLTVADNGVGLAPDANGENLDTPGLQLVRMLAKQVNATVNLDRTHGTAFHLHLAYKPQSNQ